MNFQTFSTFRPISACSDVTEIGTIKKNPTDHLQTSTEGIKLLTEKVLMSKMTSLCKAVLELFKILGRWGGVFLISFPSQGGLTWSDYFAVAERAAFCCDISRTHLALAMIDEAGLFSMSIPTKGILLYFRQCR